MSWLVDAIIVFTQGQSKTWDTTMRVLPACVRLVCMHACFTSLPAECMIAA